MASLAASRIFDAEDLHQLVICEHKARFSAAVQELKHRAEDDEWSTSGIFSWLEVLGIIQHGLCARFLRWYASHCTALASELTSPFAVAPAVLAGDFLRYVAAHRRATTNTSGASDTTDTRWFCNPLSTPMAGDAQPGVVLSVPQLRAALRQLRCAAQRYPELGALQIYVRANRATRGLLRNGDPAPDIALTDAYTGAAMSLHEIVRSQPMNAAGRKKPVIVLAVSYT